MKLQAMILGTVTAVALAACADAPTGQQENGGISASATALEIGDRVQTTRYIAVRTTSAITAPSLGDQPTGAQGTIVGGPVTTSDGLTRWQVNFNTNPDGWVVGKYILFIGTTLPPPPAPVATVTVSPSADTLAVNDTVTLQAVLRDANGNVLTGRTVTWTTSAAAIATITNGLVRGVASGSATMTATSEGRTGTSTIVVPAAAPPPPPTGGSLMFSSDFRTATGRTTAALLDTGKPVHWDMIAGSGQLNQVIPSTGLDFPTQNVLRVQGGWRGSPAGAAAENPRLERSRGHLRVPAVGETTSYRWYIRVATPNNYTADDLTHPIQDGMHGEDSNWQQEVRTSTNGTWTMTWNVNGGGQNAWPNNRWQMTAALQKNQTYRVEVQVHRTGTNAFNLHARVYNSAGTLIASDANFRNPSGSATLANNPSLRFFNVNHLAGFQAGFNGLNGGTSSMYPIVLSYQSGFVITKGGWPGPYGSVAGEQ